MAPVKCPRCQTLLEEGRCPECDRDSEPASGLQGDTLSAGGGLFPIEVSFPSEHSEGGQTPANSTDWKAEIRKKLDEHSERKQSGGTSASPLEKRISPSPVQSAKASSSPQTQAAPPKARLSPDRSAREGETERPLFTYRMEDPEIRLKERKVVTLSERPFAASSPKDVSPPSLEKPLVRVPGKPKTKSRPSTPLQKELRLPDPVAAEGQGEEADTPTPASQGELISREVLFSRALAGIVDLSLAAATGVLFAVTAVVVLEFDFFSAEALQISGIFALFFFYLNSLFFLLASGRTPGMLLTDLQLVADPATGTEDLPTGAILVRVALFLPTVATVVGLLYGVFDPLHRCLHDRLSGTRVVPLQRG